MFELEKAIADWRQQMLAAGIKTPVPLDELENHLREDVEQLKHEGLSEPQAFETAVLQIGQACALKSEFAKAGGNGQTAAWIFLLALAFAGCWAQFGKAPAVAIVYCVFLAGLIAASFIDFKHFIIPDKITIAGIFIGLSCSILLPQLHGQRLAIAGAFQSLLGISAGAASIYFILRMGKRLFGKQRIIFSGETKINFTQTTMFLSGKTVPFDELFYRKSDAIELHAHSVQFGDRVYKDVPFQLMRGRLKVGNDTVNLGTIPNMEAVCSEMVSPREVMGMGDVKLMAAVGAFLGWQAVIFSLIGSSLIGSLVGVGLIAARRREWSSCLPYGPFIALAATIWIFGGKHFFVSLFSQ